MTNTLNKIMHNGTEYDFPEWFTPWNAWTTGQVVTKTANGYEYADAPVTSVNWNTWAVTVSAVPSVWTNGQVLTVVSWASAWANLPSAEVQVSTQANNIFTSWMKIWGWTEADYLLLTPDSNTAYLLTATPPYVPISIDDSFTGNTLDTSIWTAEQLGSEGSLTVNNGLTISCGSTLVTGADVLYQGYRIYTNATYQWTETSVTAEVTFTWITWSGYMWWTFTILWHECSYWTYNWNPVIDWVTWMEYTTWNSQGYRLCKMNSALTWWDDTPSYSMFTNGDVVKVVLDITNDKSELYVNWTLKCTYNPVLSTAKTWSSYVWQPLLTISPLFWEGNVVWNISNVKVTTA